MEVVIQISPDTAGSLEKELGVVRTQLFCKGVRAYG